jgi:ATP-binding cassette subfamily B protein
MDSGPACLRMISEFYGKYYSMDFVRERCYVSKGTISIINISEASESIGFRSHGVLLSWDALLNRVPLPCIVQFGSNHFVIVYQIKNSNRRLRLKSKISKDIVCIADPKHGLLKYTKTEFIKLWLGSNNGSVGNVLTLEPTPKFYSIEDHEALKLNVSFLLSYLKPYKKYLLQLVMGMFVGSAISMIFPFLTQSIVDVGISNSNLNFVVMVLVAQLILHLGRLINEFIRSWLMLHLTTRLSISLISDFLLKLMRLPISYFDTKMVGDIMQRIGDHNRIQTFLSGSLISIIFSMITLLIYTIVMANYNIGILFIFFIGSFLYVLWVVMFLKKRRNLDYKRFQQASMNQSNMVQLVTGMQEIKLNGCEKQKRWEWERIQAKLFKVKVRCLMLTQNQQIGANFINETKDLLISFIAAKGVIEGNMTLGMMMAVQYIIGQLNSPIQRFIGFTRQAQDAKISLERLGEIHQKQDEEKPDDGKIKCIPKCADIKIKDLTFQYMGPNSEKVLNNINLDIPANKVTAIVGTSGSGKTTLIKMLLGYYQPTKGRIYLNGVDLDKYSPREWRKNCGIVMQESFIFSDTVANNVGVADEIVDREKLQRSLIVANINEFVDELPLRHNTLIGSEGHGVSSGQRQRLLIARAIYKDPDYIFLDEATNSLDTNNERTIVGNLDKFFKGRTVVVVAHRLSTIKKADNIVVLEKGFIVEQGKHNDLIKNKGGYYKLVKDQLEL